MMTRKRGAPIKAPKNGPAVDLSAWSLIAEEAVRDAFLNAVSEALDHAITDSATVWFPQQYEKGEEAVIPADTIRLGLPLTSDEGVSACWDVSLKDAVEDFIDWCSFEEGLADERDIKTGERLRDMFRGLADRLDDVLPENRRKPQKDVEQTETTDN